MNELLSPISTPTDVIVRTGFDGVELRFAHGRIVLVGHALRVMLGLWAVWFVLVLLSLNTPGFIRDLLLTALLPGFLGTLAVPVVAYVIEEMVAGWTVATLKLGSHQVVGVGVNGRALPTWNVHDLQEVWVSRDWVSSVVAIRNRAGEVSALRVEQVATAQWLARVLEAWRQERGTEPTEEAERLQQAMRARVGQPS